MELAATGVVRTSTPGLAESHTTGSSTTSNTMTTVHYHLSQSHKTSVNWFGLTHPTTEQTGKRCLPALMTTPGMKRFHLTSSSISTICTSAQTSLLETCSTNLTQTVMHSSLCPSLREPGNGLPDGTAKTTSQVQVAAPVATKVNGKVNGMMKTSTAQKSVRMTHLA